MNESVDRGLAADALHTRLHRTQELLAESRSATLIPDVTFGDIDFGFWRNNQFSGNSGRARFVSRLPRTVPRLGFSQDSLFCAPVPVFASRGPARPLACPQGHPTGLPPVEALKLLCGA